MAGNWKVPRVAALAIWLLALSAPVWAVERVALVVGNADYDEAAARLRNPVNDATAMAAALRRLGFRVIAGTNLDEDAFYDKIAAFEDAVSAAKIALFFYAGHGLQVDGRNYLAPVDLKLERKQDLKRGAVELADVLEVMRSETNLVILDACRTNPLAGHLARSLGMNRAAAASRGLARVESASGMLIAYATEPDDVASDGTGRHSPYTEALLKHLETPGLSVNDLFTQVTASVLASTGRKQRPWTHASMSKVVRLVPGSAAPVAPGPEVPAAAPVQPPARSPESVEAALRLERSEARLIQLGLAAEGFNPGSADGWIGDRTRTALRQWQSARGKTPTGYLDADSARLLMQAGKARAADEDARREAAEAAKQRERQRAQAEARRPIGPKWAIADNQLCQVYNPGLEPGDTFTFTWSGGCLDRKASGEGRLVWQYNEISGTYLGWVREGVWHGPGSVTYSDGDHYEGHYRDGQLHGWGTYTGADGDRYEGEWRDGKRQGRGTFTWADGGRYDGEWREGEKHGRGIQKWANDDRYEGDWRDGSRTGRGTYTWSTGDRYDGEWRDDKMHGRGTFTWADGTRHEGEWRDNERVK